LIGDRRGAAARFEGLLALYLAGQRPRYESRLEPLHEAAERLGDAWSSATSPALKGALFRPLELTHKALHRLLKPDETAEGRAFALARQRDPAANSNAQSIVIHSLHREGAPGISPKPADNSREAHHNTLASPNADQKGG
jgi:hypothetical protein